MRTRLILLSVLSLLFVLVSTRLWLQSPLVLIPFEFDYWLGLFSERAPASAAWMLNAGRLVHLFGFLGLGGLFASVVRLAGKGKEPLNVRQIAVFVVLLSAIWTIGMPWVSPDVFFYLGTGWLDGHYGLSPYLHSIDEAPGFAGDSMFANVFPRFLAGTTSYGPLFQLIARAIALVSGGRELLALGLFKAVSLALHRSTCWAVLRLAPLTRRAIALLAYGCNPLILFSLLTGAHNDGLMILLLLCALVLRNARRPGLAGAALGAATSAKYASILLLPLFLIDIAMSSGGSRAHRLRSALGFFGTFVGVAAAPHLLYPEALQKFLALAGSGITVYRNSIYLLLPDTSAETWRILVALFVLAAGACVAVLIREARTTGRFRLVESCLIALGRLLHPAQPHQSGVVSRRLILLAAVIPWRGSHHVGAPSQVLSCRWSSIR